MLLYSMLYLTGFGLELDDIEQFRQWGSRTPGHPEYGHVPGVEVTTGPLGQGIANAVGIALAEANLRERFGPTVTDHHVFAIWATAASRRRQPRGGSLAGHLGLGRLVAVYDDNHITIDGPTELALTDDPVLRFEGYGWHVVELGEVANDLDALERGDPRGHGGGGPPERHRAAQPHRLAVAEVHRHGEGPRRRARSDDDEVRAVKEILGLPPDEHFVVPDDVLEYYRAAGVRGRGVREAWEKADAAWRDARAGPRRGLRRVPRRPGLDGLGEQAPDAGRRASRSRPVRRAPTTLDAIIDVVPGLVGGGADLTGNTGTKLLADAGVIGTHDFRGRQIHFGVREHGMGAIMNGMASGGLLPFGGTFFVFSDYMRGAVRLAALSGYKVAFVWSHDSVGVGEDGPTHQPIEQLAAMRAMPGLRVIRPADANETAEAWRVHLDGEGPTAIVLTRQKVPVLEGTAERAPSAASPAARTCSSTRSRRGPDLVLIGTGSEVQLCVGAHERARRARRLGAGRLDAVLGAVRGAARRRAGRGAAARRAHARGRGRDARFGWERYADDTSGSITSGRRPRGT